MARQPLEHPLYGRCRDFDVAGEIPQCQGLYVFGVETAAGVEIRYVGMTTHLWMVTKGHLPDGRARGGQRYGRPRHAGATRQRINAAMTAETERGAHVSLWIRPRHEPGGTSSLRREEERAIERWQLRTYGLNRGGDAVVHPRVAAGDSGTNRPALARHPASQADAGPRVEAHEVWSRIVGCAGEIFRQVRGGEFRYQIRASAVCPDRTNRNLPRSHVEAALALCPLPNTTCVQHLQGPSYLYAILMDPRVRGNDW